MKKGIVVFASAFVLALSMGFANSAESQPIKLRFAHFMPTKHPQHKVMADWAKKIGELTDGRVTIKVFPGGALGKPQSQYPSCVKGVIDIAFTVPAMLPGRFPLTSFEDLPFLFQTGEQGSIVLWKTYEKYLQDEYKEVKVLWQHTTEPGMIHTTKKPVRTLEDLKGLKLSCPNATSSNVVAKLGAVPVTGIITDFYEAMQRGVTDGTQLPMNTMAPFRFFEVLKYHTMTDLMLAGFAIVMNKKKYESLPADIKKIIDDNIGLEMAKTAGRAYDAEGRKGLALVEKNKNTIINLSKEERERWVKQTMPVREDWAQEMEQKGLPGRDLLQYVVDLAAKYQ